MITVKVVILTCGGMSFHMHEITKLDEISTNVVAMPIEKPKSALVVTARVGHIAKTWTKIGFCLQRPLQNSLLQLAHCIFYLFDFFVQY